MTRVNCRIICIKNMQRCGNRSILWMNIQVLGGKSYCEDGTIIKTGGTMREGGRLLYCLSPIIAEKTLQTSSALWAVRITSDTVCNTQIGRPQWSWVRTRECSSEVLQKKRLSSDRRAWIPDMSLLRKGCECSLFRLLPPLCQPNALPPLPPPLHPALRTSLPK